ncbi:unnamed protein product, partial [Brachionus calyciflorus]
MPEINIQAINASGNNESLLDHANKRTLTKRQLSLNSANVNDGVSSPKIYRENDFQLSNTIDSEHYSYYSNNKSDTSTSDTRVNHSKDNSSVDKFRDNLEIPSKGSKDTQHGIIFQLKLLMLLLWRAKEINEYEFRLATEMDEAGKFDDVVFQYKRANDPKWKFRLLQAKHKEVLKTICKNDLLSNDDENPFSLQKYFNSYLKIKEKANGNSIYSVFSESEIEDLIIITNTDFHNRLNNEFNESNEVKNYLETDKLLNVNNIQKKPKVYKICKDGSLAKDLKPKFEANSDFNKLVNQLSKHVLNNKQINKKIPIFKEYQYPLIKEVFVYEKKSEKEYCLRFKPEFIRGDNLSEVTKEFRDSLKVKIKDLNDIQEIKCEFATPFIPNIINVENFAKEIYRLLKSCLGNNVKIDESGDINFKKNIKQLAGHVLIKRFEKIRFSSAFLYSNIELPGDLKDFREILKQELQNDFETIYKYEFDIKFKFETCEEYIFDRKLPVKYREDDADDFFDKLKFVVNYPNRFEINEMLENEIKIKIKKLDSEAFNSLYQNSLHDWLANRIGTFFTADKAKSLFDDINKKLFSWTIEGINISYFSGCVTYSAFVNCKFKECQDITSFLNDPLHRILNFVCQDLLLGRIRLVQTFHDLQKKDLTELQKYTRGFGHLFVHLQKLLNDNEFCEEVLSYFKDTANLLVIECDTQQDIPDLDRKLTDILNLEA